MGTGGITETQYDYRAGVPSMTLAGFKRRMRELAILLIVVIIVIILILVIIAILSIVVIIAILLRVVIIAIF